MAITELSWPPPTRHEDGGLEGVKVAVEMLPKMAVGLLATGPSKGCRVCETLRGDDHPACRWLVEYHGSDPVRCGIIYGLAAAVIWRDSDGASWSD